MHSERRIRVTQGDQSDRRDNSSAQLEMCFGLEIVGL